MGVSLGTGGAGVVVVVPVAAGSLVLIADGALRIGTGVALFRNRDSENKTQFTKREIPINQIDKKIQRGQSPKNLDRTEHDYRPNTDHRHFKDGCTIYHNGQYKHGSNGTKLTNYEKNSLKENGFKLPNE